MKNQNKNLFVFTIGPVSSFIEGSRKMRDLYSGSFLLSYLLNELLKEIHSDGFKKQYAMDVIFPHYQKGQKPNFIPNRIVAETDIDEKKQKEVGTKLEHKVKLRYRDICEKTFNSIGIDINKNQRISKQLQSILHIYWTFVPLKNGYKDDYPLLVTKINQVKSIRPFIQLEELPGKKCSLYPQYNALIINTPQIPSFICKEDLINLSNNGFENNKCRYSVKEKENLSAFALLKRAMVHAEIEGYDPDITSVAHVLAKYKLAAFPELKKELDRLESDGGIETIFDLQNGQQLTTEEYSKNSIETGTNLYKKMITNNIRLKCYYALIKFDGDGFGNLYKNNADQENHKEFSQSIIWFAKSVKKTIEANNGVAIFAGGEDFLGFLPVNNIFVALKQLRKEFQKQVKLKGYNKQLTFSAGITIAHLMEPLSDILRSTSDMENYAKHIDEEKDAFAIKLVKRSGEVLELRCKFGTDGENLGLFDEIRTVMTDADTSKRLLYNLITALVPLKQNDFKNKNEMVVALISYAIAKSDIGKSKIVLNSVRCGYFEKLYQALGNDVERFLAALNFLAFWMRECD